MIEWFARVFAHRTWWEVVRDIVDIIIVAYVIYRALLVIRGTRAMQMGMGLGVIFLVYLGAKALHLVTLLNLLSYLLSSIILIIVVVFQNDIRRALIRVGGQAWFGRGRRKEQSRVIDEVVAAVTELARHRIGAIIAFEQDANLLEFAKREGTLIGAAVTRELLVTIFYPESVNKLHDGAVVIRDLKIARAGMFFDMPETKVLDKSLGTRHQASLGITEETDAVVVVVSEERGTISFCFNGNIVQSLDGTALRQSLVSLLETKGKREVQRPKRDSALPRESLPPPPPATTSPLATPVPLSPRPRPTMDNDARSTRDSGILLPPKSEGPSSVPPSALTTPVKGERPTLSPSRPMPRALPPRELSDDESPMSERKPAVREPGEAERASFVPSNVRSNDSPDSTRPTPPAGSDDG